MRIRKNAKRRASNEPNDRGADIGSGCGVAHQGVKKDRIGEEAENGRRDAKREGERASLFDCLGGLAILLRMAERNRRNGGASDGEGDIEQRDAHQNRISSRRAAAQSRDHGEIDLHNKGGRGSAGE